MEHHYLLFGAIKVIKKLRYCSFKLWGRCARKWQGIMGEEENEAEVESKQWQKHIWLWREETWIHSVQIILNNSDTTIVSSIMSCCKTWYSPDGPYVWTTCPDIESLYFSHHLSGRVQSAFQTEVALSGPLNDNLPYVLWMVKKCLKNHQNIWCIVAATFKMMAMSCACSASVLSVVRPKQTRVTAAALSQLRAYIICRPLQDHPPTGLNDIDVCI